jgi:hypothetical protein
MADLDRLGCALDALAERLLAGVGEGSRRSWRRVDVLYGCRVRIDLGIILVRLDAVVCRLVVMLASLLPNTTFSR